MKLENLEEADTIFRRLINFRKAKEKAIKGTFGITYYDEFVIRVPQELTKEAVEFLDKIIAFHEDGLKKLGVEV